jgi:hypothetical protein
MDSNIFGAPLSALVYKSLAFSLHGVSLRAEISKT